MGNMLWIYFAQIASQSVYPENAGSNRYLVEQMKKEYVTDNGAGKAPVLF